MQGAQVCVPCNVYRVLRLPMFGRVDDGHKSVSVVDFLG